MSDVARPGPINLSVVLLTISIALSGWTLRTVVSQSSAQAVTDQKYLVVERDLLELRARIVAVEREMVELRIKAASSNVKS